MITKTIKLSDIKISDAFARTHVSERKLQKCRDYFDVFEKADRDIVLSSKDILIDGYIMYLVYKENNIEEVEVKVKSTYRDYPTTYIYGKHVNGSNKVYVWRIPHDRKYHWDKFVTLIEPGDIILCRTKYGTQAISVADIQVYDKCPVNYSVKKVACSLFWKVTATAEMRERDYSCSDNTKEIDKDLEDTLQILKELSDESALYSTSGLMRELQIIRNGYEKGE